MRVIVCLLEQANIVGQMVHTQTSLKILGVPLNVFILTHVMSSLLKEIVRAAEKNDGIWVDVLLELGGILFGKLFWCQLFTFLSVLNFITFSVFLLWFGLRFLRRDIEHFE